MWNEDVRGENGGATYSGYTVFAGETIYAPKDYWDVGYKVIIVDIVDVVDEDYVGYKVGREKAKTARRRNLLWFAPAA